MNLKTWANNYSAEEHEMLIDGICNSAGELGNENLKAFADAGFAFTVDAMLMSIFGKQIIEEEYVGDHYARMDARTMAQEYLFDKERYLAQIVEYFNSEYNPIENYSQVEHETVNSNYGDVVYHGIDQKGEDSYQHGAHTDKDIYQQVTDTYTEGKDGYNITQHTAKVQTQTTPPGDTTTTQTSPYEDETYYNKQKNTVTHTQGSQTVERIAVGGDAGDDKTSYTEKVNETISGAHTDKHEKEKYTDTAHLGGATDSFNHYTDAREDSTERKLTRSGNIGVQTAAQMLKLDSDFWQEYSPLKKIARDIAGLLCVGMEAI